MLAQVLVFIAVIAAGSTVSAAANPVEITIQELLAAPQGFHGKIVAVRGYFECVNEAGCELRASRVRQDRRLRTIFLDFSQEQMVAVTSKHPLHGQLRVVGRFEYSRPTPDRIIREANPHDPIGRKIISVWQGFSFHSCQITAITECKRI